ncbi:hypothetical protein [Sphingomonas sp. KR3-1]|uniref:hypothetical protein n=1 Tax=Sphingomonas sp. KR3-1 TaxID=3156611 RepID=UPI0032B4FD17
MIRHAISMGAALVAVAAIPQAQARDSISLSLPVIVDAAPAAAAEEEVGIGTLFAAQGAHYLSVATIQGDLKLGDGTLLLPGGTRLFEHRAEGKAYTGKLYCRMARPSKMVVLLCLADQDADGRFEALWLGRGVVGRVDRLAPGLPYPDATRAELSFDTVGYQVGAPDAGEGLRIGFYISGSNPLLGQHHFYQALGGDDVAIPMTATHRAVRLSSTASTVEIAGSAVEARKLGKGRYAVRLTRGLPAGERALVDEYQAQTQIIYVPGH